MFELNETLSFNLRHYGMTQPRNTLTKNLKMALSQWTLFLSPFVCISVIHNLFFTSRSVLCELVKETPSENANFIVTPNSSSWIPGQNRHGHAAVGPFHLSNSRRLKDALSRRTGFQSTALSGFSASFLSAPALRETAHVSAWTPEQETEPRQKLDIDHKPAERRPCYLNRSAPTVSVHSIRHLHHRLALFSRTEHAQLHKVARSMNNISLLTTRPCSAQKNARTIDEPVALSYGQVGLLKSQSPDLKKKITGFQASLNLGRKNAMPERKPHAYRKAKRWLSTPNVRGNAANRSKQNMANHPRSPTNFNHNSTSLIASIRRERKAANKPPGNSPPTKKQIILKTSGSTGELKTSPDYDPKHTGSKKASPETMSGFRFTDATRQGKNTKNGAVEQHLYAGRGLSISSPQAKGGNSSAYSVIFGKSVVTQPAHKIVKRDALQSLLKIIQAIVGQHAMKCLALFLAGHKYFGFDPRKGNEITWKYRQKGFYVAFPRPRLKKLHPDVVTACSKGAFQCVNNLATKAAKSPILKDTKCILKTNSRPANATEYYPFESAIELFRYRTSASYYMCWHAINRRANLVRVFNKKSKGHRCLEGLESLNEPFNNQKRVLDFRDDDTDYQCALVVFCPDPCYGRKTKGMVPSRYFMTREDPGNPCRGLKDKTCSWIYERNSNFDDLQRNRFNISCQCDKERRGFAWDSKYQLCVDVDECLQKETQNRCGPGKRCQNTVGGYDCLCRPGYVKDSKTSSCEERVHIPRPVINHTLLRARYLQQMMKREGVGDFLEKQFENLLGLNTGFLADSGFSCQLVCVFVIFLYHTTMMKN